MTDYSNHGGKYRPSSTNQNPTPYTEPLATATTASAYSLPYAGEPVMPETPASSQLSSSQETVFSPFSHPDLNLARNDEEFLPNWDESLAVEEPVAAAFGACIEPLLTALHWTGENRHIIDALPHLDELADLGIFGAFMLRLGYKSRILQAPLHLVQRHQFPCLATMEDGLPYVLLSVNEDGSIRAFRGDQKILVDIQRETKFDRLCLFDPIASDEAETRAKTNWSFEACLRFRRPIVAVTLLTIVINIVGLATPLYVMNVYDKVIGSRTLETLYFFFIGVLFIVAVDVYFRLLRGKLLAFIGARFDSAIMSSGISRLLNLPILMTENSPISSQHLRIKQYQMVMGFFSGNTATAALDLPFTLFFFVVIGMIGGPIIFVPIGLAVVYCIMSVFTLPVTRRHIRKSGRARIKSQNLLLETMEQKATIRQLGLDDIWLQRVEENSRYLSDQKFKSHFFETFLQSIAQSLVMVAGILTLWVGARQAMEGNLTTGALLAIMILVWRVLSPIQTMFLSINRLIQLGETATQINQLMRTAPERGLEERPALFREYEGKISIENLSFRFNPKHDPVFRGLAIEFEPGTTTALAGENSSGKSTLLKFVVGLYQPQSGGIYVDGLNLQQVNVNEWRSIISYTPSDPVFFYGTVAQNFRMYEPTVSNEKIIEALNDLGLSLSDSELFPGGLDTRLTSERNEVMTTEILQRISLARGFTKNAPIYLFDEPAAILDEEGDKFFQEKLKKIKGSATIIIATNRPSILRLCDDVAVLKDGELLGRADPEKAIEFLMKAGKAAREAT